MRFITCGLIASLFAGFSFESLAVSGEWPQFLGPNRNGTYAGDPLATVWPQEGPPIIWQKKIGQGFSGPVVASEKLILFHRLANRETVECLESATGGVLWKFDYPTAYRDDFGFDEGPRATPAISDGKVFTFGAEGALHCLEFATGKKVWSVQTKAQFSASKGFFGMACSPLVEGDHVLLNIGGANGAGIVAFDKTTGALAWKATEAEASYSSPVAADLNHKRAGVFFTRVGLVILDPKNGRLNFEFPWRPRIEASVSAATPLIIQDRIFLSASYETGAILLSVQANKLQKVWSSDDALSNHYATSVHHNGFLYGFHGRQESGPSLRCVELRSGKVRWSEDRYPAGTVTLAGEHLLILLEDGRLILAAASPDRFKAIVQAQILPFGVRAYPALAGGFLYARSKDKLVCVDLRRKP
ncbi:MAG: PQQ-like beta-propeller repeat protein [Verrucomicrobia bacterium]|nr:PQQ-like beta-propeller repeat protein [Verrucomicrobiota bacterium]